MERRQLDKKKKMRPLFDDDSGLCGTMDCYYLSEAIEDYHKGLPLKEGVVVQELTMHLYDEWEEVGMSWDEEGNQIPITSPLVIIEGDNKSTRIYPDAPIDGFEPEHGHEYIIRVRRFGLKGDSITREYELLEVLEDKYDD